MIGLIIDAVRADNVGSTIRLRRLSLQGLLTVVTLKTIDLTLSKLAGFGAMFLNRGADKGWILDSLCR